MPNRNALIFLKEEAGVDGQVRQNFYFADLESGTQRQLTDLRQRFRIASFDVSPDGKQIVFDLLRDNADIVLMDLAR